MTTLPLDDAGHPVDGGYTPAVGVTALQTGTPTTDGLGKTSAPLNVVVVPDASTFQEVSALSAGYFGAYLVPIIDLSAFKWWSLHVTGAYNGTLAIQISNDGVEWDAFPSMQMNTPGQFQSLLINQTGVYGGPVIARYLSVQMVAYSTGIATGTLELYTLSPAIPWAASPQGFKTDSSGVVQPVVITDVQTQLPIIGSVTASNLSTDSTGNTTPADATYIGGNQAGALTGLTLDGSANLNVNIAADGGGHLSSIDTNLGARADTAATSDSGTFSLIALTKRLLAKFPSAIGQQTKANSLSVTIASDQGTQATSVADGANVTIGTTTDATYTTGAGTLVSLLKGIFGRLALGQQAKSASLPVTLASDQGTLATSVADGANVTIGTTTDATYTTGAGTLVSILKGVFGRLALGQQTKASSLPVTLASDQGTLATSVADGANVTIGTTTDAAYTSGSGTVVAVLKGIFGRLTLGQTTMSASLPVVIASDQSSLSTVTGAYSTITDGSKTVTTAGTRVQITASTTTMKAVVIVAMEQNTGIITVGGSGVVATQATRKGIPLLAGDSVTIGINDLSKVYLDATVSGEGITYVYYT